MNQNQKEHPYFKQATLMLETLPFVAEEDCFALKGGTAINFFVRNMPRLSVDIDLTYLPIQPRVESLTNMAEALKRIAGRIQKAHPRLTIQKGLIKNTKIVTKLYVSSLETQVIIEPNLTLRGTLFPAEMLRVCSEVKEHFGSSASIRVVSKADLYGGKICAALDRQHPRDLYDVKILLENEGLTPEIRKGLIIYLCSHDETMSQLLDPPKKDITETYKTQFLEMPTKPVSLEELLDARDQLISIIKSSLTESERKFIVSIKEAAPKWELLGVPGTDKLPAIQWKLANIRKMKPDHHRKSIARLKAILGL
jgi:predicted nucleotidyltransferase component of viral defense system